MHPDCRFGLSHVIMLACPVPLIAVMQRSPLRALMHCESALLGQRLASLPSGAVLYVQADGLDVVECPARSRARLHLTASGQLGGDMIARADAWPFADQSLDLVVMRHSIEISAQPRTLMREATRVLADGGQMLIIGIHPCSLWNAWMLRRKRATGIVYRACMPWKVEAWLREAQVHVERRTRYGGVLPTTGGTRAGGGPLAACYMLQARKRSIGVTPIKLRPSRPTPVVINASMAGAARRQQTG